MSFIAVKGTHDLYGEEASCYAYIENVFKAVCELYGYQPIETPILEYTEVFDRATGESSDVVRKEMYTFLDKGNRSVTLRPEGTAGVIRALVEKKLYATADLPIKAYYVGPVFRYERPQLGRYRQFIQAGVEAVGVDSPRLDAESIILAMRVLGMLGFTNLTLKVNTLGDLSSRQAYKEALREFFAARIDAMCEDCHQRLRLNPMRILDCKVPDDQKLVAQAPKMRDYLSPEAEKRFYETLSILNDLGVDYEIDEALVRGLDYYGHIVFEVHGKSPEGVDYGALLGGGHYQGMLAGFGGPKEGDVGVGFALGVERLYALMRDNNLLGEVKTGVDIYAIPVGEEVRDEAFRLVESLRSLGYSVELPYAGGKLASYFKKAERAKAKLALILGEEELSRGVVQLKDLKNKFQFEVSLATLGETLDDLFGEREEHHHHHEE